MTMIDAVRRLRNAARRRVARAKRRWAAPRLTAGHIATTLNGLSESAPALVMVHSSLSACGEIEGGAATVIEALRAWIGNGTLAMPTHSYCYPVAGRPAAVFDPARTPSVVGAITEAFRRRATARRSTHPTHSLAAEGPLAEALVEGHDRCATPCGAGTPYERLIERDAAVLMFGVKLDAYTLFHTAEDAAAVPYLYQPDPIALRFRGRSDGEQVLAMRRHDLQVVRTFDQQDAWLESEGLLRRVRLGDAELLWIPHARAVHDALVARLRRSPWFLTAS